MPHQEAHDYMPVALATSVPKLYAAEKAKDPTAWIKLFTPDSSWSWYVTYAELGISDVMPRARLFRQRRIHLYFGW